MRPTLSIAEQDSIEDMKAELEGEKSRQKFWHQQEKEREEYLESLKKTCKQEYNKQ